MKKLLPISIVIISIIAIGVGAFYGGIKYAQTKASRGFTQGNFSAVGGQNLRNLSPGGKSGNQTGGGFVSGEIISKDDKSVTVKLQNGGSKIIFYSDTTEIGKFVNGTANDLEVGKSVVVNGKTNQDGSITAETIQLRSNLQQSGK